MDSATIKDESSSSADDSLDTTQESSEIREENESYYEGYFGMHSREKLLKESEIAESDFMPRQIPRTDNYIPEARNSPFPIGPVRMRLSIVKVAMESEIRDVLVVTCSRQGEVIGSLKAIFARRDPISPVFSEQLQLVYTPESKLRRELIDDPTMSGSGVWGTELDVGDCLFIDLTGVLDYWEGLGIGKHMASLCIAKAKDLGIRWIFAYPHSWDHRERRREGQLDLAVGYWRSV